MTGQIKTINGKYEHRVNLEILQKEGKMQPQLRDIRQFTVLVIFLGLAVSTAHAASTLTLLDAMTDIEGFAGSGGLSDSYAEDEFNVDNTGLSSTLIDDAVTPDSSADSKATQELNINTDAGNGDFIGLTFDAEGLANASLIPPPAQQDTSADAFATSSVHVEFTLTEEMPWSVTGTATDQSGLFIRPGLSITLRETSGGPYILNYLSATSDPQAISEGGVLPPGDYSFFADVYTSVNLFSNKGEVRNATSHSLLDIRFTLPEPATAWLMLTLTPLVVRRRRA